MEELMTDASWGGAAETQWEITSVGDVTSDGTIPIRYVGPRGKMITKYILPEQATKLHEGGFMPFNLR